MTRVLHYAFDKAGIKHDVYLGKVSYKEDEFAPHYWIQLKDKRIVDCRARMWLSKKAAHGLFNLKNEPNMKYEGKKTNLPMNDTMYQILTM